MKKDIKSQTIDNSTKKYPVESKTWKSDVYQALKLGYKVEALNEEQAEYIKKIETKLAEKAAKAKVKEEMKQTLLKKMSDIMKAKKAAIVSAANDLADRIILRAIEKEEQKKKFDEADKKIKEKVKKDKMAIAEKKRERKAELRNKTIPSPEAIANAKKQQDFLAKAHAAKREEIEARLDEKENFMNQSAEEWSKKHEERIKRNTELALKRLHHKEIKLKRTTKAERIEAIKAKKEAGKAAFNAEMKRQASEIAADRQGYANRVEKRRRTETERLAMIAERRKLRKDKIFTEHLKQQKIQQLNLKRFIESEKARLARKEEKRAKYLTTGGIKVPKVKNNVAIDKTRAEEYIKVAETKMKDEKERYIIRIASIASSEIISDSICAFICKPEELNKRMKEAHNKHMKEEPDTYVGIYAYSGIGKDQKCVSEMLNDKFKDRSRLNPKSEAA
jgi:putative intracellular protein transport protein USO1